jgi:hypothetical protein
MEAYQPSEACVNRDQAIHSWHNKPQTLPRTILAGMLGHAYDSDSK